MSYESRRHPRDNGKRLMIPAMCFGAFFGFPLIAWGLILILDRDRSWQRHLRRSQSNRPLQRTRQWDRRQIIYGALLAALGIVIFSALSLFNYLAQGISPPPPF